MGTTKEKVKFRMNPPSKKWISIRNAALERVSNWLIKWLERVSVIYAGALGIFLHWWIGQELFGSGINTNFQAALVMIALVSMAGLAPAIFTLLMVRRKLVQIMG